MDLRLVQPSWSGCCDHRNQVTHFPEYSRFRRMLTSHPHSFACATFISTVATINTGFVPDDKTTIGVYAAVLISQGEYWKIEAPMIIG